MLAAPRTCRRQLTRWSQSVFRTMEQRIGKVLLNFIKTPVILLLIECQILLT